MSKPIQDGGELDEAEVSLGEFVVARSHATEAFDSGEEVFDPVAPTVVSAMERHGLAAAAQPSNANPSPLPVQLDPKVTRIETFVANDALASKRGHQGLDGFEIVAVARGQAQGHRPAVSIHDRRQLGVDPALAPANRLQGLAAARIGAMVMHLDVRTIHVAELSTRAPRQCGQHPDPQPTRTPPPPTGIDRTPRSELFGHIAPRTSRAQDIPDRRDHEPVILRGAAATVPIGPRRVSRPLTLIFLAEPTAAPATPSVL